MAAPGRSRLSGAGALGGAALLLCIANLLLAWPGTLTPDSRNQLDQAIIGQFTDWHPPFMAMLWRLLGPVPSTMLILQVAVHWLGIWAFAAGARRARATAWPWLIVAVGMTPIALKYTGVIQKDTLLASLFLLAFGLAFLTARTAFALPFGIAATLCRANGAFALPPLLFGAGKRRWGLPTMIATSLALAVMLVPLVGAFNSRVLGARDTGVQRSVQLFDMAGIAHFSGDRSVLPAEAGNAATCYTPLFWDALDRCIPPLTAIRPSLTRQWVTAIVRHPLAYAEHRLSHFNRTTFFLVPPMQQCVDAPSYHQCDFSRRGYLRDAVQKNALLWPVTWLVAGLLLLAGDLNPTSRSLVVSGLLYGSAYLIVGVAADFRYFYWTELAIQIAMALQLALAGRITNWGRAATGVGLVWAVGYAARLLLA